MSRPNEYQHPTQQICAALPVPVVEKLDEAAEKAGCSRTKYLLLLIENDSGNLAAAIEVITKPLREEIERLKAQGNPQATNQPAEPTDEQAMLQACQENIELVREYYTNGSFNALTELLDRYEKQFDRVTFKRFIEKFAEAHIEVEKGLPI